MPKFIAKILIVIILTLFYIPLVFAGEITLSEIYQEIQSKNFIDLTHTFEPGIPHWQGFPDSTREMIYWYEPKSNTIGSGFFAETYCHVGQWGTHIDAPVHFVEGLRAIDEINLKETILPLVVIDVSEEVLSNPDYRIQMEDVKAWEGEYGTIPIGAFVAMRTDWSKKWPNLEAFQNKDENNIAHYPGWSLPVLEYLYQERKITATGHETTDTDPGIATSIGDYSLEKYILGQNHYQIELLTNLDQVPESGGLIVISFPKPKGGSGFPARVFAIVPSKK